MQSTHPIPNASRRFDPRPGAIKYIAAALVTPVSSAIKIIVAAEPIGENTPPDTAKPITSIQPKAEAATDNMALNVKFWTALWALVTAVVVSRERSIAAAVAETPPRNFRRRYIPSPASQP